jgi:hypothetical protein
MPSKKKKSSRCKAANNNNNNNNKKGGKQGADSVVIDQRLKIDDDTQKDDIDLLEEAIKLAALEKEVLDTKAAKTEAANKLDYFDRLCNLHTEGEYQRLCYHGYEDEFGDPSELDTEVYKFVQILLDVFYSRESVGVALDAAKEKTRNVWGYRARVEDVLAILIFAATENVISGDHKKACFLASFAAVLKEDMEFTVGNKAVFDASKGAELLHADQHTLLKYLKGRIFCSCLDEKYKQVKSITKLGFCHNTKCPLPNRHKVERSSMFYCTRCRSANYCSAECQRAAWSEHKALCDENLALKAAFDSRKEDDC